MSIRRRALLRQRPLASFTTEEMVPHRTSTPVAMTRSDVALGLQRALLGEVSASLSGVAFKLHGRDVEVKFYFRNAPTDDDREMVSAVITELIADLPLDAHVDGTAERMVDSPESSSDQVWVFRRRD